MRVLPVLQLMVRPRWKKQNYARSVCQHWRTNAADRYRRVS